MANENKMQYVILGLLTHEPMTGYQMKKRMDGVMNLFWSGSYGSIYPTLQRLKEQGYVTSKEDVHDRSRNKIIYDITEEGHEFLKEWLVKPVVNDEIRYETLLKMFFGSEIGSTEILKHIQNFESKTEEVLPKLKQSVEVLSNWQEDATHEYYMLTAMCGVRMYEACLAWCKDVKEHFERKQKLDGEE